MSDDGVQHGAVTVWSAPELERRAERVAVLLETMDEPYEVGRNERRYEPKMSPGDPYDTRKEVSFDPGARSRQEEARRVDQTIERLQELELVRDGVYSEQVEHGAILEAAERRDARGSYREVRKGLEVMPPGLRGDARNRWLARRVPGPIRIPREYEWRLLERLAPEVERMSAQGFGTRQISAELGLRRGDVREILQMLRWQKVPAKSLFPEADRKSVSMVS